MLKQRKRHEIKGRMSRTSNKVKRVPELLIRNDIHLAKWKILVESAALPHSFFFIFKYLQFFLLSLLGYRMFLPFNSKFAPVAVCVTLVLTSIFDISNAFTISSRATVCNGHAELCSRSYGNVTFIGAHDSYAIGSTSQRKNNFA